jgi:uridine kinase
VRVVVVAGPSGAGKSRLCDRLHERFGVPVVNLDDFYKDGDDPSLPWVELAPGQRIVDWDDPRSWSCDEALAALAALCREGRADLPVYDLAHDGRVGTHHVDADGAAYVVAEGLFAHEVVAGLRRDELLADAVCVRNRPLLTFWRRLTRDLREHRKPPLVLVRRGWRLMRREPAVVARAVACGCEPLTGDQAHERLSNLLARCP